MSAQDLHNQMMRTGRINLCLYQLPEKEWTTAKILCPDLGQRDRYRIEDWNEQVLFRPYAVKESDGAGWYNCQYDIFDVWFIGPDGYEWWGRRQGNNEAMNCRRLKKQSLSWRRYVGVCKDGREISLEQMETQHIERCIAKINRSRPRNTTRGRRRWRQDYLPHLYKALEMSKHGQEETFYSVSNHHG
jgi:hypothetical protein